MAADYYLSSHTLHMVKGVPQEWLVNIQPALVCVLSASLSCVFECLSEETGFCQRGFIYPCGTMRQRHPHWKSEIPPGFFRLFFLSPKSGTQFQ